MEYRKEYVRHFSRHSVFSNRVVKINYQSCGTLRVSYYYLIAVEHLSCYIKKKVIISYALN